MFQKRQTQPKTRTPTEYPHGTFIKTEKGYFYIVNDIKRYRLLSTRVLDSWQPHRVVETSESAVKKYKIAARMKFRNGSLIWNLSDGKVYLIENGKRRWIRSPDVFDRLNIKLKETQCVSQEEIELHPEGETLV